jgi:hypothetical protein
LAKSLTEQCREATAGVTGLTLQVDQLRRDVDDLESSYEKLADEVRALALEVGLLKQRLDLHLARVEKWDSRIWGLIVILFTAIVGLVVAVVKK